MCINRIKAATNYQHIAVEKNIRILRCHSLSEKYYFKNCLFNLFVLFFITSVDSIRPMGGGCMNNPLIMFFTCARVIFTVTIPFFLPIAPHVGVSCDGPVPNSVDATDSLYSSG